MCSLFCYETNATDFTENGVITSENGAKRCESRVQFGQQFNRTFSRFQILPSSTPSSTHSSVELFFWFGRTKGWFDRTSSRFMHWASGSTLVRSNLGSAIGSTDGSALVRPNFVSVFAEFRAVSHLSFGFRPGRLASWPATN